MIRYLLLNIYSKIYSRTFFSIFFQVFQVIFAVHSRAFKSSWNAIDCLYLWILKRNCSPFLDLFYIWILDTISMDSHWIFLGLLDITEIYKWNQKKYSPRVFFRQKYLRHTFSRQKYLWHQVQRWKFPTEAYWSRNFVNG